MESHFICKLAIGLFQISVLLILGMAIIEVTVEADHLTGLKYQVVLLQTAHYWANAGVLLCARMHRERGSFRSNYSIRMKLVREK